MAVNWSKYRRPDSLGRRKPQPSRIDIIATARMLRKPSAFNFSSSSRACARLSLLPSRQPSCFTPLTRLRPAASSGLSRAASAASYASLLCGNDTSCVCPVHHAPGSPGDVLGRLEWLAASAESRTLDPLRYPGAKTMLDVHPPHESRTHLERLLHPALLGCCCHRDGPARMGVEWNGATHAVQDGVTTRTSDAAVNAARLFARGRADARTCPATGAGYCGSG